jgi:hypothetical protein
VAQTAINLGLEPLTDEKKSLEDTVCRNIRVGFSLVLSYADLTPIYLTPLWSSAEAHTFSFVWLAGIRTKASSTCTPRYTGPLTHTFVAHSEVYGNFIRPYIVGFYWHFVFSGF